MLRDVVLTQYRRVTDRQTNRQTDGIAVASTAVAMRELRRAVKVRRSGGQGWRDPSALALKHNEWIHTRAHARTYTLVSVLHFGICTFQCRYWPLYNICILLMQHEGFNTFQKVCSLFAICVGLTNILYVCVYHLWQLIYLIRFPIFRSCIFRRSNTFSWYIK